MNLLIRPAMILFGFDIKWPMKVDMPLNKETKPSLSLAYFGAKLEIWDT